MSLASFYSQQHPFQAAPPPPPPSGALFESLLRFSSEDNPDPGVWLLIYTVTNSPITEEELVGGGGGGRKDRYFCGVLIIPFYFLTNLLSTGILQMNVNDQVQYRIQELTSVFLSSIHLFTIF
jgi:hypothetical protein